MRRILGLPSGAWITASVGIGITIFLYHRNRVREEEAVVIEPTPTNEPLGYQSQSGYSLGGGTNTPGSIQVGEGEVGRSRETPTKVGAIGITPGQTPPIINPTNNPITAREEVKIIHNPQTPPIINPGTFEPGWIAEKPHPIQDTAIITSEAKTNVMQGGGPPQGRSNQLKQSELVVVHGY